MRWGESHRCRGDATMLDCGWAERDQSEHVDDLCDDERDDKYDEHDHGDDYAFLLRIRCADCSRTSIHSHDSWLGPDSLVQIALSVRVETCPDRSVAHRHQDGRIHSILNHRRL